MDSDPAPDIFVINLQGFKTPNKNFFSKFFCLFLFEGTFTSFFKDKKSKRIQNTVGIKLFLTIFAWWQKDLEPDPYNTSD